MKFDALRKCLATLEMSQISGVKDRYSKMREEAEGEIEGNEKEMARLRKEVMEECAASLSDRADSLFRSWKDALNPDRAAFDPDNAESLVTRSHVYMQASKYILHLGEKPKEDASLTNTHPSA